MSIVRVTDCLIQWLVMDVEEPGPVVAAATDSRVLPREDLLEEVLHLLAVVDPRERGIMTAEADTGMQHDAHQEARLPFGEAVIGDRFNTLIPCHSRSSPATSGSNGRRPWRLVRAPTRPPPARYRVNPARAFEAACAPR